MSPTQTLSEPGDLRGFPAVHPPETLVRVCRRKKGTWWFSSDGSGRFDLESPEGTCYFAIDEYAAIREASRLGPVTPQWVVARETRHVASPEPPPRLAGTTERAAGRFGVTQELITVLPYDLPQRWAAAFRAAGFAGILHQLRHDQRPKASGIALFGPEGAGTAPDGARKRLTREDVEAVGVRVLDPPDSAALTVVD